MSLSVSLGRHFEDYLARKVASGRYGSASEVLRDALRLLEEQDVFLEHKLQAGRGACEGRDSRNC